MHPATLLAKHGRRHAGTAESGLRAAPRAGDHPVGIPLMLSLRQPRRFAGSFTGAGFASISITMPD